MQCEVQPKRELTRYMLPLVILVVAGSTPLCNKSCGKVSATQQDVAVKATPATMRRHNLGEGL